jgi:predicted ATP-dependent serine protease
MKKKNINWVCNDCGNKHGKPSTLVSTWHWGKCDMCEREVEVTEPRDFSYLKK